MKVRNGFVSNSSSSSFIFVIGEIVNIDKVKDILTSVKNLDKLIVTKAQLLDKYKYDNERIIIDRSNCFHEVDINTLKDDVNYLVLLEEGNEGDRSFYSKHGGDLDWDISLNYFTVDEQLVYNYVTFNNSDILKVYTTYGVGRDG